MRYWWGIFYITLEASDANYQSLQDVAMNVAMA